MVHLSTLLILSTILLLVQLSFLSAAQEESSIKKCCPGDSSCSGCWMCPESDLRNCWDAAVKEIDQCHITDDLSNSADTFCRGFAKLAQCWSTGRCCSEYAPLLAAATNLCNLKTWSPQLITRDELEKFVSIANATRNAIWHNDSGIKVPKLTVSVDPHNSTSNAQTQSDSSNATTNPQPNKSPQRTYYEKSAEKKDQPNVPEEKSDPSDNLDYSSAYEGDKDAPEADDNPQANEEENKPTKNHQEDCMAKANSPNKRSRHYHQTRWSKTRKDLSKRAENPLHKRATHHHHNLDLFKRNEEGDGGCGLDFQGVPYPEQVPETVAHVFAEL